MTGDLPEDLKLPSWLDRYPVVDYAARSVYDTLRSDALAGLSDQLFMEPGICRISASEQIEVFRRLATDQRMERVWRELYRKKRGSNEFLNPVQRERLSDDGKQLSTLHDPQHQHTAVAEFFYSAWFFAVVKLPLTQDKINSRIKPYKVMASKLRKDAEGLRSLGLNELAAVVEFRRDQFREPPPGTVK